MATDPENTFVRPEWTAKVFRDPLGNVIEHGSRWPGEAPATAYGTTSNPERFEPLHQIAVALIDYLVRSFAVRTSESSAYARTLVPEPPEFVRLVRLAAESGHRTSLTMVFTAFPGIAVYAGTKYVEAFPACGCDACDDSVDDVVDRLQSCVLDLAGGHLRWESRD